MCANQSTRRLTRAFTLRELLLTISMLALLALVAAPGPLQLQRRAAQLVTCADRLGHISRAVTACSAENNGYGPTFDDGDQVSLMLTWTDLLYDLGYLPALGYQLCPADQRPDFVTQEHGSAWNFYFVDHFGVNEPIRHGVRTSYAINFQMATNFAEDKFEDASRQVYAIDGWWSWFACLNAAWVLYEQVTGEPPPSPLYYPNDLGTMVGWRHGMEVSANVLYLDGHVAPLTPIVPDDAEGLLTDTVDTMLSFTWLPGERDTRPLGAPYQGEIEEYWGRRPYWTDPEEGTYKSVQNLLLPIDFPEELSCSWRTFHSAWLRLPNDPHDRR